ncbi:MAG: NAD(P)-dependent oxidoreductase [Pseudomonadota bacterium]
MPVVVVAEALTPQMLALLERKLGAAWEVRPCQAPFASETMRTALADADALLSMRWPADAPADAGIRVLHLNGAGYDGVCFDHVPRHCTVCNVYEHEIGIAEYVIGAMLQWETRLAQSAAGLRQGHWLDGPFGPGPLHGELHGKTIGFVGYGRIAHETAKRLRAFGMGTMARTRSPARIDDWIDDGGDMRGLHGMLENADYVLLTPPLTAATRHLADAAFFAHMRSSAVVINVARGGVIEEQALYDALAGHAIGGAIIDTWYEYPTDGVQPRRPGNLPFHELDNILMTPHASGWSAGLMERRFTAVARNLEAWRSGRAMANVLKAPGAPPIVDL